MPPRQISVFSTDALDSACARLRLADPIRSAGLVLNWHARIGKDSMEINLKGLEQADLIVIQRAFPRATGVETLLDTLFSLGIPVIYETDDLLTGIPGDNPMADYSEEAADILVALMQRCCALTVSTPALAGHYRHYNPKVHVQPNPIDEQIWTARPPAVKPNRRLRVGFAGSATHVSDLRLVEEALLEILARHGDEVELCLFGCATERLASQPGVLTIGGGLPYAAYAETLCQLQVDIGIAPLVDTPFNQAKSDIKWLEYSMAGIAGIYSRLPPYGQIADGETGLLVGKEPAEWVAALERLLQDHALRHRIASQAQREVLAQRTMAQAGKNLASIYEQIILEHSHGQGSRRSLASAGRQLRYAQWLDANLASRADLVVWAAHHAADRALQLHAIVIDDGARPEATERTRQTIQRLWHSQVRTDLLAPTDGWADRANHLLASSGAEWVVLLWSGDQLAAASTWYLQQRLHSHADAWAVYFDEDGISATGGHDDPLLKPDFDLQRLRCANYLGRNLFLQREQLLAHGGLAPVAPDLAGTDALLRQLDAGLPATGIVHIARLAVHRDQAPLENSRQQALCEGYARVINAHLARRRLAVEAQPRLPSGARWPGTSLQYQLKRAPLLSVIIPTRDGGKMLQRCLETLVGEGGYPDLEILVLNNQSRSHETLDYLNGLHQLGSDRLRVIEVDEAFNFSRLANLGASAAHGEFLLFLNDDTAGLSSGWLAELAARLDEADVAAVSPRLLFPDGRVQHAGIVLGLGGAADFAYIGAPIEEAGYAERLICEQEVSAASAACLLIKRAAFQLAGGFDEEELDLAYGDFDLCLRLREHGYRILWTPSVSLLHETGHSLKAHTVTPEAIAKRSASFARNRAAFMERWLERLAHDPYYNPGHSLQANSYPLDTRQELMRSRLAEANLPRLVALPADASGSGYYRVTAPTEFATKQTRIDGRVLPGYPDALTLSRLDVNTLFTQRQVDDNHLQALAALRRDLPGMRVVMDFDDLLTAVRADNPHSADVWPDIERRIADACGLSDCVTVSTAALADALRHFHDDIRVIPNAINPEDWPNLPPRILQPGRRLRVGWAGGMSHAGDLALLAEVIPALARKVDWVFFGLRPPGVSTKLYEFHPGVPFADYRSKLASLRLDLALAPLAHHRFNECKSNLRLLEYGILGIPVIASDITPYQCGLPVTLLPGKAQAWKAEILARSDEARALQLQGEALRNAVITDWKQNRFQNAWLEAWTGDTSASSTDYSIAP
ncbi:glycosyltransferase [Azoarcus indigens]|uniref:glycosyltransferase n=1 Tax=Azoarcus indigens TaxID=29545 RepID=UPI00105D8DFF|nr:glycosyltransferase [Azoarcus indigens]NMG64458.1 glycosyltransferase [Azoarcus indigens]